MIKYTLLLLFIPASLVAAAQPSKMTGDWAGSLQVNMRVQLRLVFHIKDSVQLTATLDSPDQGAFGIVCDEVITKNDSVYITIKRIRGKFYGLYVVQNDTAQLNGFWQQGPNKLPLSLRKVLPVSLKQQRPQHPVAPFPYNVEEVQYSNKDGNVALAGTLTLPKTTAKVAAVILITGSGPQDRDETIFGHKPFWVIADALTKQGYAVLRVDDRGTGKSKGDVINATSLDFASDVLTSLDYLKTRTEINPKQIGLLGHSEGGIISALVAAKRKDVAFMVLLASPSVPGHAVIEEQGVALMKVKGVPPSVVEEFRGISRTLSQTVSQAGTKEMAREAFSNEMRKWFLAASPQAKAMLGSQTESDVVAYAGRSVDQTYNPWFRYFLQFDPAPEIKKSTCPVLALYGERDIQVIPSRNMLPMQLALKASRKGESFSVQEVKAVNHLFQHCKTCTIEEYGNLTETFATGALDLIAQWINTQLKSR